MDLTMQEELAAAAARLFGMRLAALRSLARQMGLAPPALTEADRIAALRAAATPPAACGPDMPAALARGVLVEVEPLRVLPTVSVDRGVASVGYEPQHAGYRGRNAARALDVWDRMAQAALRTGAPSPFSRAQVATARRYAALVERHSSVGLRCVSVEAGRGGGGGDGGFMVAVIREGNLIRSMERAVGGGFAVEVRRAGGLRRSIPVLTLLREVACEGRAVSAVLTRYGWAKKGDLVAQASAALAAALDRMGYTRGIDG